MNKCKWGGGSGDREDLPLFRLQLPEAFRRLLLSFEERNAVAKNSAVRIRNL